MPYIRISGGDIPYCKNKTDNFKATKQMFEFQNNKSGKWVPLQVGQMHFMVRY